MVLFAPLSVRALAAITATVLDETRQRLAAQGVGLTVTDELGADDVGAELDAGGDVTVRDGLTAACLAVPVTAVCARVTDSRT